ncbi:hypothetical protein M409DRAFT_52819 [Zasmidium cellare ATCC 36951]|uniref:Transcription factor domain-containing protein n=1 Tax=Zasmidium cellare ATCC 36951 TaxID=1080233 RepID=A0A6A6CNV2_ZASCE|nr:uncharacterized protein M409DRAFT_52819 [Zasmidium cellare ATCC 36951]KAF2168814.1 hypothetical protein M409DRAFT_52819 [Zasmidium cellare ATCC 36951]
MVDRAFSSLALLVFARSQKSLLAAKEASTSYQRLLKDMQSRILQISRGNIGQTDSDEILLTIYFMARYESVVQQDGDSTKLMESMKVWSHFDGVAAILRLWHDDCDRTAPSSIVKLARRTVVKSSLLRERQIPQWLRGGERFGEKGLALEFDRLAVRTIALRQECVQLERKCDDGSPAASTFEHLSCEAIKIGQALHDWVQHFPRKWEYNEYKIEGVSADELWSPAVSTCTRHGYAAVWTEYYSIRMLLMNAPLQTLDAACPRSTLEPTSMRIQSRSERLACEAELNAASDSLASLIPFCLGRIRAHDTLTTTPNKATAELELSHGSIEPYLANLVVWPLSIAASLQHLDVARREWFRSWLSRISSSSCECLVAYAMSDYWTVL